MSTSPPDLSDFTPDLSDFTPEPSTGTAPPVENVIRPAETGPKAFLENLMSDIQSGTTITPVGRVLRGFGAQGTRSGVSGETGAIVGGPAEGIPRALHGFLLTQQARVGQPSEFARGANEMFQGVGQVAAPIAGATNPAFLPMAAGFGIAQQGGQATAGALGASPETSQFLGNLAGMAALGAPKLPGMFGAKGTPAERLSFALSKTLPKAQWAKINERLAAVGEKVPEVVGGAKTVADAASKMKQRSLDLGQQFSDAIQPVKGNDISPQVAKLRVSLEQAAQNADPYNANAYRSMAEKVSDLKTLGQLDDFVAGFNKTSRFNAAPESVVRQALTETVRGITGQDFSPLRLEQSHWYTLARAAQKAAIPEQLASLQSKVASPSRKLAQFALEVPKTTTGALLSGAKLLQPSAQSLIRSIPEAPASAAGQLARSVTAPPDMPPASPFDVARMANKAAAMDPNLKALDAQLRQRAAAFQQQREALGPLGLESQQTFNPSPNPADIPPAQPYYQRYGQVAEPAAPNTAEATAQHATALDMARARLGPNASLGDILQEAAKIQNPK